MKRLTVLCLIIHTCLLNLQAATCNSCLVFKENKGQWQQNILYKSELKSGAAFFEKGQITFNLFDPADVMRIKGDHHRLENFKHDIDYGMHFHAFRLKFLGASVDASTTGQEAISEYFNYFLGSNRAKWASKVRGFNQLTYAGLYKGID